MVVVAFALIEFSKTVMTGGVVSAVTVVVVAVEQTDVADRQTVYTEHLQQTNRLYQSPGQTLETLIR